MLLWQMLNNINCSVQLFVSNKQQKRERSKGHSLFCFKNGADDCTKSEPETYRKNLQFIKDMLLKVKSAEYNVLEFEMQMVYAA